MNMNLVEGEKDKEGFTLVEMIIYIVIIGICCGYIGFLNMFKYSKGKNKKDFGSCIFGSRNVALGSLWRGITFRIC